jgi:hypothetical protein
MSAPTASEDRWAAALDEAERVARAALDAGEPPPAPPLPPGDLGPLPPALADRVLEVLALTEAAVAALAERRDHIAQELVESTRRPSPFGDATPRPRFVDHDA